MGNTDGLSQRITMHLSYSELRVIRAALRFAQASKERPLTFDQDEKAGTLVRRISSALISD